MSGHGNPAWKKFDPIFDIPSNLEGGDACYYARERLSHGGYKASETNGLISNFKIDPSVKGSNAFRWKHKVAAIEQFAVELGRFIPKGMMVTTIPQSKCRSDPGFDPRFDMLFDNLTQKRPDLTVCEPIVRRQSVMAAHLAEARPSVEEILATLEYVGFKSVPPKHLVFIDDVVTTGKHFSACRRLILKQSPPSNVYGVFWAKTIWSQAPDVT